MKSPIFLFFIAICFLKCSNEEIQKYPVPTKVKAPLVEKEDYAVEEIYEGTNKYNPTAVIVSTKEKYTEPRLSKIKHEIIQQKLTKSDLERTPFVVKNEGEVYGVLFHYYTREEKRNELISIDTLKYYVNQKVEKIKNRKDIKVEVLGAYAFLDQFESEGYKRHSPIFGKDLETGDLFWGRYKIDQVDDKLMINTKPYDKEVFYEFEIKLYESGDAGFHSHINKGLHNYYLKIY